MSKEPTEPRTFRLDVDIIKGLEQEARKQGATVNGLVCRVLRNYVRIYSKVEQMGTVSFMRDDLVELLKMLDEEEVAELGRKIGALTPKEVMLLLFGEHSLNTFRQFLMMFLYKYANWVSVQEVENEDFLEIRAGHTMGSKWSIFLKNYIESAMNSFDTKPEFRYVSNATLVFRVKKS